LLIGIARVVEYHVVDRFACQQRDAVVGFLPDKGDVIARRFNFVAGELGVFQLQFLQAQHIRLGFGQPVEQMRQTDFE